jgi:hypothetical protein
VRVSEDRVARMIFGPKRGKLVGEWRRLLKEELCALYFSPDIFVRDETKMNEMNGSRSTYRERYMRCFGEVTCGSRPLGRPRLGWESDIKIYF